MDTAVEDDDHPFFASAPQHEQLRQQQRANNKKSHHHPYDRPFGNSNNDNDELVLMAQDAFGDAFLGVENNDHNGNNDSSVYHDEIFLTASLEHPDAAVADHWDIMKVKEDNDESALFPEEDIDEYHHHDHDPQQQQHQTSLGPAHHHFSQESLLEEEHPPSSERRKVMDYRNDDDDVVNSVEEEEVVPPPLEDVSSESEKTEGDHSEDDDDDHDDDDEHHHEEQGEGGEGGGGQHYQQYYESETGESHDRFLHALKKFAPREEWPTLQTAVEHHRSNSHNPAGTGTGTGTAGAVHPHSPRRLQQQQLQLNKDHPSTLSRDKTSKHLLNTTAQTANTTMTLEEEDNNNNNNDSYNVPSPRLTAAAVRGAGMAAKQNSSSAAATIDNNNNNCNHSTSSSISTALDVMAPATAGSSGLRGSSGTGTGTQRHVVVSVSSSGGVQRFNKLSKRLQQKQQQQSHPQHQQQPKRTTTTTTTRDASPKRNNAKKTITITTTEEDAATTAAKSKASATTNRSDNITTSSMSTPSSGTERRSNRGGAAAQPNNATTNNSNGGSATAVCVLGPVASAAQRALKQAAAAASNRRLHPQTRQEAQLELDILAAATAAASMEESNDNNIKTRGGGSSSCCSTSAAADKKSIANAMVVGRVVTTLEMQASKKNSITTTSSFTNAPVGDDLSILVKDRNSNGGGTRNNHPHAAGGQRSHTNDAIVGISDTNGINSIEEDQALQQRPSLEQIFLDLMRAEKRTGTKIYSHPPPPQLQLVSSSSSTVSTNTFPILPLSNRPPRRQQHHNKSASPTSSSSPALYSPVSSRTTTASRSTASQSSNSSNRRRRSSSVTRATMSTSGGVMIPPATTNIITPGRKSQQGQQPQQGTMVRSASSPSLLSHTQSPDSISKEDFLTAMQRPLLSSDRATSPWADDSMADSGVRREIPTMDVEPKQQQPIPVSVDVSEHEQSVSQAPTLGTTFTKKLQDAAALESYSEESLTSIDQKELDTSILTAFLDYVGAEKDEVTNRSTLASNKSNKRNITSPESYDDTARSIQSESTTSLVVCAVPGRGGSLSGNAQSFCVLNSISEALEGISGEGIPQELGLMRDRCVDQCDRISCIDSNQFMSRDGDTDDIRQTNTVLSASESFTTRDSSVGTMPREEQAPLLDFYFFEELVKEMAEMELKEISKIPFTAVRRTNVGGVDRSTNQDSPGVDRSDTLSPDTASQASQASTTLHQFQTEFPRLYDRLVLLFGTDRLKKLATGKFQKDAAKKLIEELMERTKRSSDAAAAGEGGAVMETNSSRGWLLDMAASSTTSAAADEDQQQEQATKAIPKLSPPRTSGGNDYSRSALATMPEMPITPSALHWALATMPAMPITPSELAPSAMGVAFQTPSSNVVAGERPVSPPNVNRTATIEAPPVPPSPHATTKMFPSSPATFGSAPIPKRPLPDTAPDESLAPLSPRRSHGSCPTTASPLNALMGGSYVNGGCDEEDPVEPLIPDKRHFLDDLALPSMKDRAKMNLQSKALLANLTAARMRNELWSKNPIPESPLPEQQQEDHQESPDDAPELLQNNSNRSTKPRRFLRNFALLPGGGQKRLQAITRDDAEDNVVIAARKMRALRNPLKATKLVDIEVTEVVWGPTEASETNTDTFKGGKSVKRRKGLRRAFMKSEKSHAQDSVSLLVKQTLPEDDGDDECERTFEVATRWEAFDPYKNDTPRQHSSTPASPAPARPAPDQQDPPGERALTEKKVDSMPTTVSSLLYGESHPKFAEFGPVEYTRGDMEYDVVGREITVISSD